MTSFAATVIRLNNIGAELIRSGEYRESIVKLGDALRASRQLVQASDEEEQQQQGQQESSATSTFSWCPRLLENASRSSLASTPEGLVYTQDALTIPVAAAASASIDSYESTTLISSIIMFNLALSHHLAAYNNNSSRTSESSTPSQDATIRKAALLQKASVLYQHCFSCLSKFSTDGDLMLYPMLVLNNMGVCHSALGQNEQAEHYFEALWRFVLLLPEQQSSGVSPSTVAGASTSELRILFFENIAHKVLNLSVTTASAA